MSLSYLMRLEYEMIEFQFNLQYRTVFHKWNPLEKEFLSSAYTVNCQINITPIY